MPHVSVHYRIYLGAGHHRQPRNHPTWVEPPGYASESESATGSAAVPAVFPTIPLTPPGGGDPVNAFFAFWAVSDDEGGRTQSSPTLQQTVGATPLVLIAWYFLPGGGDGEGSGVLLDAYSVAARDFIDDNFVDVTSDPSLTSQANVAGFVPTGSAQTLDAFDALHAESFESWVVASATATASGDELSAPAGSGGLAFATYAKRELRVPSLRIPSESVAILFGVIQDGGGAVLPVGGGPPIPIDPWGPLIARLLSAISITSTARQLGPKASREMLRLAVGEIGQINKEIDALAQKQLPGG